MMKTCEFNKLLEISDINELKHMITKALLYGVSPHNMPECKAKNYLMRKVNRKASVKLYQEVVFIYKNGRLITAYKLPKSVK